MSRSKVTAKMLRENGWKRHPEGIGWTKNGAFYGAPRHDGLVGQFDDAEDSTGRIQMGLPYELPPEVTLHLINAFASARELVEP